MAKITAAFVEALGTQGGDRYIGDDQLSGFGLRITASGTFLWMIRKRDGAKVVKRSVGRWPEMSVRAARSEASRLLGLIASGKPLDTPQVAEASEPTFEEIANAWLRDHVRPKLKEYTRRDYERITEILKREFADLDKAGEVVRPWRVSEVTPEKVRAYHARLKDMPRQGNYRLQVVSAIFNFSELPNPTRKITKYREGKKERIMSADEMGRAFAAISECETEKRLSVWACQALRFAIATGARPGEIRSIEWTHLDRDRKIVVLPDSKSNRRRIISTNGVAWTILTTTPKAGRFVFAGVKKDEPYKNLTRAWETVRTKAKLEDVRLYDARHTFASEAAKAGHALPMIGELLGHTVPATTARYVHLTGDPVRKASEDVGSAIASAMAPKAQETVVPIKRRPGR